MSKPRIIKNSNNSNNIDTIDTSEKFFLSNEIILNSDLSFDARLAYIALRYYKTKVDYVIYDYLSYVLSGEINNPNLRRKIVNGLLELEENNIISIIERKDRNGALMDLSTLWFSTKKGSEGFKQFTIITFNEIRKIMNLDNSSPERILLYFCVVISTLYKIKQAKVGDMKISDLTKIFDASQSTVLKYNSILCENNLLYICKANKLVMDKDGRVMNSFNNVYSRPEDKAVAEATQRDNIKSFTQRTRLKTVEVEEKAINQKRSLSQKLIQIKKHNKQYSAEVLCDLLNYINERILVYTNQLNQLYEFGLESDDPQVKNMKQVIEGENNDYKLISGMLQSNK